jgi:hypothetical protein
VQNPTVTLKEVLETIDAGHNCALGVITCDVNRKTGGEYLVIANCKKAQFVTSHEQKEMDKAAPKANMVHKNPNHYENSTRNIIIIPSMELRKIHIRLIRNFNGKTVL